MAKPLLVGFISAVSIIAFIVLLMFGVALLYSTGLVSIETLKSCCYVGVPVVVLLIVCGACFVVNRAHF